MKEDVHSRAGQLLAKARIEGITEVERVWIEEHLESCPRCAARGKSLEGAVRELRSAHPQMNPALAGTTRLRLRMRARELAEQSERQHGLWIACVISWVVGVVTAPLAWRGFEWLGEQLGLSSAVWQAGFALWWLVPAVALAGFLAWQRSAGREAEVPDRR
jgi:anti-sigma factor RsiW